MTTYKVRPPFGWWNPMKPRTTLTDDSHILATVTPGAGQSDLQDLLISFAARPLNCVRGRYLVLEKAQMEPLINAFDCLGRLNRLEFRRLPEKA
ncbi:hypothetical protein [Nonomuraea sp. NPDC048826]|uniref:hypothetical protein n=1 Tax=Nonomuraea sp. NPDC048826 TaxID=3364347 RepID=UPI00371ED488